jgi:hypothetical protein
LLLRHRAKANATAAAGPLVHMEGAAHTATQRPHESRGVGNGPYRTMSNPTTRTVPLSHSRDNSGEAAQVDGRSALPCEAANC